MKLYAKSRLGLFDATATYDVGKVVVKKGSKINLRNTAGYEAPKNIKQYRENDSLFCDGILMQDITFDTLSSAAGFVTGRFANGKIVWKTEDGRSLKAFIMEEN